MHLHHPGLGDYETYPESQSKSEGKQFLESGAQESKAQSPLWPAPPGGTQHEDSALAWDQEEGGCPGKFIQKIQGHEERHRE